MLRGKKLSSEFNLHPVVVHELNILVPENTGQMDPNSVFNDNLNVIFAFLGSNVLLTEDHDAFQFITKPAANGINLLNVIVLKILAPLADKIDHVSRVRVTQIPAMALNMHARQTLQNMI